MLEIFSCVCVRPKNVEKMEGKKELGGKNGFGAERNRALSKVFLNGTAHFYFHFFFPFFLFLLLGCCLW